MASSNISIAYSGHQRSNMLTELSNSFTGIIFEQVLKYIIDETLKADIYISFKAAIRIQNIIDHKNQLTQHFFFQKFLTICKLQS